MERRDFLRRLARMGLGAGAGAGAGAGGLGTGLGMHGVAAASTQRVEYAKVLPGRRLVFPADHGAHPDYRTEWWYATGWLKRPDGQALGFQTTFFRVRTGIGEGNASAFAPRQLILAHAAIADPELGRLRHDERAARVGFGRAGYETTNPTESGQAQHSHIWIGDWRFEQTADTYRAEVRADDFSYALNLVPDGPPMLNGRAGFSAKDRDPRHASYYYSRPQLKVDGLVIVSGKSHAVTGQAWLDHEWSSELLPEGAQGWDWIGINLDGGGALMAFRMRGSKVPALWAAATTRTADGATQTYPAGDAVCEEVRRWRSPRTAIEFPVEWRLRVGGRNFVLQALMDDQELDSRRSTGAIYWEGAVRLHEAGREIGRGYLEMTGYGEKIKLG